MKGSRFVIRVFGFLNRIYARRSYSGPIKNQHQGDIAKLIRISRAASPNHPGRPVAATNLLLYLLLHRARIEKTQLHSPHITWRLHTALNKDEPWFHGRGGRELSRALQ